MRTKCTVLTLALSVALFAMPTLALAGVESDPNLNKLEMKFFQHDYAKDDADTRLDRLEKLVFGEAKTGDDATRLKNLIAAVGTNLDDVASSSGGGSGSGGAADSGGGDNTDDNAAPPSRTARNNTPDASAVDREQQISDGSQYPAVTAMERKVFKGQDYTREPIVKRLERLEKAEFGKISDNDDLSDRVDRLKAQTGVDLARTPPPGSDWSDDEDQPSGGGGSSLTYIPPRNQPAPRSASSYNPDDDPMFNNPRSPVASRPSYAPAAPAWTGGDGSSSRGSGGYGYNPPAPRRIASLPPSTGAPGLPSRAPDVVGDSGGGMPAPAGGLVPQISSLEKTVFGRSYTNEGLAIRLNRLESAVFPGTRPQTDLSITDRVNKLVATVGGGSVPSQAVAQNPNGMPPVAPDYSGTQQMPPVAPTRSGISKIINGLGNLLTGGGMGAYPMSSNLVQDPSTGLLIDTMTGNMINPTTGQVVRQGTGAMIGGYSSYNGFNSGLSPIGTPYGYGTGMSRAGSMNFGFGGSGIRFGGMGMGSGMGVGGYPIGTMTGW